MTARRLKRFEADHCQLGRCECGCGTLKLILCDEAGNQRAAAAYLPEDWLSLLSEIAAECEKMIAEDQTGETIQ